MSLCEFNQATTAYILSIVTHNHINHSKIQLFCSTSGEYPRCTSQNTHICSWLNTQHARIENNIIGIQKYMFMAKVNQYSKK